MPAVSVDNLLTLPRIARPGATAPQDAGRQRPVRRVADAPSGFEGEGFPVRRAFANVPAAELDPFIHMDQMGEVEYAPGEPKGTSWHPHRGFETVTYIIDGVFDHHDSNGGGGTITNGDTQWMTAGSGLLHIEAPPEHLVVSGGLFHGLQLWVNLPQSQKWTDPRYQDIKAEQVKLLTTHDGGALLRVVAGDLDGHEGPGVTHTPITMVHATIHPGARLEVPWNARFNALAYVLSGDGSAGTDRRPVHTGQTVVFGPGEHLVLDAAEHQESRHPALDVVLLGGQPIREPIAWYGPFVMNTRDEVKQAFEDFRHGRLGVIPAGD